MREPAAAHRQSIFRTTNRAGLLADAYTFGGAVGLDEKPYASFGKSSGEPARGALAAATFLIGAGVGGGAVRIGAARIAA